MGHHYNLRSGSKDAEAEAQQVLGTPFGENVREAQTA